MATEEQKPGAKKNQGGGGGLGRNLQGNQIPVRLVINRQTGNTMILGTDPFMPLPVCVDGRCHLHQPGTVFGNFQKVCRGKIFGAVGRGVAKRLEQPGMNQRGNIVRLAVENPARLLRVEAEGQLTQERQKPMLIFFHTQDQSQPKPKTNR